MTVSHLRVRRSFVGGLASLLVLALPAAASATHASSGPLTTKLAKLAKPALAVRPPAVQARALGLPAEGAGSLQREGHRVIVEAHFTSGAVAARPALEAAGAKVGLTSRRYQADVISIDSADLTSLAGIPGLLSVEPSLSPGYAGVEYEPEGGGGGASNGLCEGGSVVSQGVEQLNVPAAREDFGARGAGQTIGVVSSNFDAATFQEQDDVEEEEEAPRIPGLTALDDEISNDLPGPASTCSGQQVPVQVLQQEFAIPQPANPNEGRAILQIVHDVAPHAQLAFSSGGGSELEFAREIERLAEPVAEGGAGADVIDDDSVYFGEPFFQESPIGVAISKVTEEGVTYVSSAGNNNWGPGEHFGEAGGSWEAPAYRPTACPAAIAALPKAPDSCMNFSLKAGEPDPTFGMIQPAGVNLEVGELQWAEPWYGVGTDLDMYLLNEAGEVIVDEAVRNGSGEGAVPKPLESMYWHSESGEPKEVQLVIGRCSGSCDPEGSATATPRLKLFGPNSPEYPHSEEVGGVRDVVGPTIFGHNGAKDAISVASVNYAESKTAPKEPERDSSHGPAIYYFGPVDGTTPAEPLPEPELLEKPNVTASDCVATTFFGDPEESLLRFCGTSAAAPHAAGVAALMRQTDPLATTAQIVAAMESSATPFTVVGGHEAVGAGLLNADAAITALGGSAVEDPPSHTVEAIAVEAELTPASEEFKATTLGDTSSPKAYTLTNAGAAPTTVYAVEPRLGNAPGDYQVGPSGCLVKRGTGWYGQTLQPEESCTISATFSPTAPGTREATLEVRVAGAKATAELKGTGVGPRAQLTPTSHDFGKQKALTSTSAPFPFTVKNTGNARLHIEGAQVVGSGFVLDFHVDASNCTASGGEGHGGTLEPGQECTVEVAFASSIVGTETATLELKSDGGEATADLAGSGIAPRAILTPEFHDFGKVGVGSTSAPFGYQLSNLGDETLHIEEIRIGGSGKGQFAIAGKDCGATLEPSATCTIEVVFAPTVSVVAGAVLEEVGDGSYRSTASSLMRGEA